MEQTAVNSNPETSNLKTKKERTIRSETTKVFLVIFCILMTVGVFTIFATSKGASTFTNISNIYVKQFQAAEILKQRGLEIIGIFYLLGSDQDLNILMAEMQRYDGLTGQFDEAINDIKKTLEGREDNPANQIVAEQLKITKTIFDGMNENSRQMTFALMEGNKKTGSEKFKVVQKDIATFKGAIDKIESTVLTELNNESQKAKDLLSNTTWGGAVLTFSSILITIGLIYYLMKFLSISLLPISNLMHNMRQAVFSIDKTMKIISPVSRYSSTVFETEIVQKDITDVVYKDLNPEGEVLSKAKFAMKTVFGEDELQWSLTESDFPPQIKFKSNKDNSEKILKLTYTPLWDKQQKVQNIMIVAEDVTEVERLREEALKKQGEIGIVQAFIGMPKADVEPFLMEFQEKMTECRALLANVETDKEARLLLFRILHTLKGNARMYSFNTLSEIIHITENTVVSINASIDSGEGFVNELKAKIEDGFNQIETSLAYHFKMANKLFGIKDRYASHNEEKLEQSLLDLEIFHDHACRNQNFKLDEIKYRTLKAGVVSESVADISKSVKSALDCSRAYDNPEFTQSLDVLNTAVQEKSEGWIKSYAKVKEQYINLINQVEFVRGYDMDMTKWVSVFQRSANVGFALEKFESQNNNETKQAFEKELLGLYELADSEKFSFIKLQITKILSYTNESAPKNLSLVKNEYNSLVKYLTFILALDSSYNLEKDAHTKLKSIYLNLEKNYDTAKTELTNFATTKVMSLSFFRSLIRRGTSPVDFVLLVKNTFKLGSFKDAVEVIIGDSEQTEKFERLFLMIKDNTLATEKGQEFFVNMDQSSYKYFTALLKEVPASAILVNDINKLLSNYVKSNLSGATATGGDMIEIPLGAFNDLKENIARLNDAASNSAGEAIKQLNIVFNSLFDQPVKSMCFKMAPMVKDLAKRLDKDVDFVISGDDIYLNREKVYSLRDALVHLIRNSLDHGVETPQERADKGKLQKAIIEIACKRQGETMSIIVKDDGKGINVEKVLSKAISSGAVSTDKASNMSEQDKMNLIFLPNLSTKDEVTNVSGRGVGMDAVKNIIEKLGGKVTLASKANIGTELTLTFPR